MLSYLRQDPIVNLQFVLDRIGEEGRQLVRLLTYQRNVISAPRADGSLMEKLLRTGRNVPRRIHRLLLTVLLGPGGMRALDIGLFRLSGEVHQWMYDRFSLSQLLLESGFETPRVCKPTESQIRGWASFNLDTLEDGTVIKPDLFYMEAIRPRQSG
jgi:hypothetical protein